MWACGELPFRPSASESRLVVGEQVEAKKKRGLAAQRLGLRL